MVEISVSDDLELDAVANKKADEIKNEAIVVEGKSFHQMTQADWGWVCKHAQIVFARVTPDQKLEVRDSSSLSSTIISHKAHWGYRS